MCRSKQSIVYSIYIVCLSLLCWASPVSAERYIPFKKPKAADLTKIRSAELITDKGTLYIELYPEDAPWHVANFKHLADTGFYRGKPFHLHRPDYIIQGGARSRSEPNSGPGYTLPPEFNNRKHLKGTIGMARKSDVMNRSRRSNGSQFHIILTDSPHLDGSFTIFGRILQGFDVAQELRKGDRIQDLKVYIRK